MMGRDGDIVASTGHGAVNRPNPKFENINDISPPRAPKARFAFAQKSISPCHYQRLHVGRSWGPQKSILLLHKKRFSLSALACWPGQDYQ